MGTECGTVLVNADESQRRQEEVNQLSLAM